MMALFWRRPWGCAVEVLAFSCHTSQPATSKLPAIAHSEGGSIKKVGKQIEVNTAATTAALAPQLLGSNGRTPRTRRPGPPLLSSFVDQPRRLRAAFTTPASRCTATECLRSSSEQLNRRFNPINFSKTQQPYQTLSTFQIFPQFTQFTLSRNKETTPTRSRLDMAPGKLKQLPRQPTQSCECHRLKDRATLSIGNLPTIPTPRY
jgi:hypothetical protein